LSKKLTKVKFTNLDKVLYPELKITKAQVIEYYIKIAPRMLDFLSQRPIVLTRFPNGIDKEGFYEKDAPLGRPSWVKTFKKFSEVSQREINYVLCDDLDTLVWLANLAALEIHMTLSVAGSFESPDLALFDLDPQRARFRQTREFVHTISGHLSKESDIVASDSRSKGPGKVFIDYVQNSHGKTMVSPYSLRAVPQATVSTPLEWKDIEKGLKPQELNIFSVARTEKNPWEGLFDDKQRLEVS
jgi:bifunctional non-homologous end joining protein LigD